jgi:hypothetical protein
VSKGKSGTQPKYNRAVVGHVLLVEILKNHPTCMTVGELIDRIIADSGDRGEVETARTAIQELRETGLITYCDEAELVEPTQAALHAHALSSTV